MSPAADLIVAGVAVLVGLDLLKPKKKKGPGQ